MQATLNGQTIAASDDIVEVGGYHYFPPATVRLDWLEKAPKTDSDRACPHGIDALEHDPFAPHSGACHGLGDDEGRGLAHARHLFDLVAQLPILDDGRVASLPSS